ncbi:trichohyalin-like [Varroa destructor]|uniref:Uncharacterized protein n=1 Tax=Varroa destructor TaxID=109461 RepID=A0A7M7MB59_VARDE|nr:trichohyalin-like [Varroa destructor]
MSAKTKKEISSEVTNFLDLAPKELQQLKQELIQCRADVVKLVDENRRLFTELKHQVRVRLNIMEENQHGGLADTVTLLQEERDNALKARDKAFSLFQSTIAEVTRLDMALKKKADYISPDDFEAAVLKLKEEHLSKVDSIERQLQITQNELRSASSSVHQLTWRLLRDGSTTLDDSQVRIGDVLHSMENLQKQYNDLEFAYQNLRTKVDLKDKQLETHRYRSKDLEDQCEYLKDRCQQLEMQISQALQHAEASVQAAELAVAERNTMTIHVQDLQRLVEQLNKKITESTLNQKKEIATQVEKIRLELEADKADLRAQLVIAQEKAKTFEDEAARVTQQRHDLNEKLNKLMEGEKIDREQRLKDEKVFRETTIQDVVERKKEVLEERLRREVAEKRQREENEEKRRLQKKLVDAEKAFHDLKAETRRIQTSMAELKKESDKIAEERLKVEQELRRKQEEENEDLREEVTRLLNKIALLEDLHNKAELEFRKRITKAHKKAIEYKRLVEILEERMRRQAGLVSS